MEKLRYSLPKNRMAAVVLATAMIGPLLTGLPAQAGENSSSSHGKVTTIYVSAQATGKTADGSKKKPFATLTQARDHVRTINSKLRGDVDVVIGAGTYTLSETFSLTERDSGSNGYSVNYVAAKGAQPVISGGQTVTGWTQSDPQRNVWKAHVGGVDSRQLYVNGEKQTRARSGDNPAGFSKTSTGFAITDPSMAAWQNQSDVEVVSRWGWKLMRCPVGTITATDMTIAQPCFDNANLQGGQEIQNPTWLENAMELLDQPGEWYLDKAAGDLYYMPKPGVSPAKATVTLPRVESLLDVSGSKDAPARDITFSGLSFQYSTWLAPSSDDGLIEGQAGFRMVGEGNQDFDSTRPDWQKTPGAVNTGFTRNVSFTSNTFSHLGAAGLNLNTGSQGTDVVGNVFTTIAGTGIQVGGTTIVDHHPSTTAELTKDTLVANNVVTDVAGDYTGSLGIFAGYTDNTVIEHNKVTNLPYSGISVGWGWGLTDAGGNVNYPTNGGIPIYDSPTSTRGTIVRNNEIGDVMKLQADGAAIYTLSVNEGAVVSGNYIHDLPEPAYGAIYHDEGSRYYTTTGNALCNIDFRWLFLNHGMDINASNNFTTTNNFATQALSDRSVITDNTIVEGCAQLPASLVANAGLQKDYQHLSPVPKPKDQAAPNKPGAPKVIAHFPAIAELSWAPATDNVAVTGYSIFANGKLVGASTGTSTKVTGLDAGKKYTFTVTARDAAGNESKASKETKFTMPQGSDLAQGKDATVSSFSEPNVPSHAVDGDPSTRWAQGIGMPDPSWIQVDLGAQHSLTGAITTFEKAEGYKYKVEVSADEVTWDALEDHTETNSTAATNYSVPAAPVSGRFLRLTVTGSSNNGGSIYGLSVYGTLENPSTDDQAPATPAAPAASAPKRGSVDLAWSAPADNVGVATYAIFQDGQRVAVTAGTSYTVTGLKPGQSYEFTIVARDAALNASEPSPATQVGVPDVVNLALNKPVTVSSFTDPHTAGSAVDGNTGTRWAQGHGLPDPSWIQVDLGEVKNVSAASTLFELRSGYKFKVEGSINGTDWTLIDDHTQTDTTSQEIDSVPDAPVAAQYVRLTVTGSNYNGGSLYELRVYGE